MFLKGKMASRLNEYETLKSPKEKATFTFRIVGKIRSFLDDIEEVNQVLEKIPIKSHKKAFKDEHVLELFDLIEKVIIGLGVLPIETDPKTGTAYVHGEFQSTEHTYKFTRPATAEEFEQWKRILSQIKCLEELIGASNESRTSPPDP
jgi:hypothetical protein